MSARIQYVDADGDERYGWPPPLWYRGLDPTRYEEECAAWRNAQRERNRGDSQTLKLLNDIARPTENVSYKTWLSRETERRTVRVRIE